MTWRTGGAHISAQRLPFTPGTKVITGVEWTTDIRAVGDVSVPLSYFRLHFAFLRPFGGGTFLSLVQSFGPTDPPPDAYGYSEIPSSRGAKISWSAQFDLHQVSFDKIFLWDNSLSQFVDLTAAASDADDPGGDLQMLDHAADALYFGSSAKRNNPSILYTNTFGGVAGSGGGPLIVEHSIAGGAWAASPGVIDTTNAFSVANSSGKIDIQKPSDWAAFSVNGSPAYYWIKVRLTSNASVAAVGTSLRAKYDFDGVQPHVDPELPPRMARHWKDIDNQSFTGTQMAMRDPAFDSPTQTLPKTVRWRALRTGFISNPTGNLWRDGETGAWKPLYAATDGNGYAMWKVSNQIFGVWRDVATYYLPKTKAETLDSTNPIPFHQEFASEYPEGSPVFADVPSDVRYGEVRVFDGTSWHDLLDWKIHAKINWTADPNYGWSVHHTPGRLASICGTTEENTVGRYLLCGLTYTRSNDLGGSLSYSAVENIPITGVPSPGYNGPTWRGPYGGNAYPWVQQEANRGWYIMHPAAEAGAVCTYTAEYAGTYRFDGDFARATTSASGDGVSVSVTTATETLFSSTIVPPHTVDVENPFSGTSWRPFDVSVQLSAGAVVRFTVGPGSNSGFDATAFRVRVRSVRAAAPPPSPGSGNTRAITPDLLQDLLSQSSDEGLMPLLTITWDDGVNVGTIRLALHDEAVTSNGYLFNPAAFKAMLPDEDAADIPLLQIGVEDVDLAVRTELRKLDSQFPASLRLELVLLSNNDSVQQTFEGTIRNIKLNMHSMLAAVELYADISREPVTPYKMSPAYGFNALRGVR